MLDRLRCLLSVREMLAGQGAIMTAVSVVTALKYILPVVAFLAALVTVLTFVFDLFGGESLDIKAIDPVKISVAETDMKFTIIGTKFNNETEVTVKSPRLGTITLASGLKSEESMEVTVSRNKISPLFNSSERPDSETFSVCVSEADDEKCLDKILNILLLPVPTPAPLPPTLTPTGTPIPAPAPTSTALPPTPIPTLVLTPEGVKFDELRLEQGPNIISIPRALAESNVNALFDPASGVDVVTFYDTSLGWRTTVRNPNTSKLEGPLTELIPGQGYLVSADKSTTIKLIFSDIRPIVHDSYPLDQGWNSIGYAPAKLFPWMKVEEYLSSLGDDWIAMFHYNSTTLRWEKAAILGSWSPPPPPSLDGSPISESGKFSFVEVGKGYWVYVDQPTSLEPT